MSAIPHRSHTHTPQISPGTPIPGPPNLNRNRYRKHFGLGYLVILIGMAGSRPAGTWVRRASIRSCSIRRVRYGLDTDLDEAVGMRTRRPTSSSIASAQSGIHHTHNTNQSFNVQCYNVCVRPSTTRPVHLVHIRAAMSYRECAVSLHSLLGDGDREPSKHHNANASTSSYHWRSVLPCRVVSLLSEHTLV